MKYCFEIKFEYKPVMGLVLTLFLTCLLAGCAGQVVKYNSVADDTSLVMLPSWYHENVGYQLMGDNQYSGSGALVHLLQDADLAFIQMELQKCQIFLERAQRISSQDSGVYVRLSYLFWVQGKSSQAEQMARRALAVIQSDGAGREEIKRLLAAIQSN